jgi:hypothetical protein
MERDDDNNDNKHLSYLIISTLPSDSLVQMIEAEGLLGEERGSEDLWWI